MAIAAPFPAVRQANPQQVRTQQGVQLTRRGRVVLSLAVTVVALVLVVFGGQVALAGGDTPSESAASSVVVKPGENLWQIARRIAPEADPRATVLRLRELNGMQDSTVDAGQTLIIPAA